MGFDVGRGAELTIIIIIILHLPSFLDIYHSSSSSSFSSLLLADMNMPNEALK